METGLSLEFKAALARLIKEDQGKDVLISEITGIEDNTCHSGGCYTCDYDGYDVYDVTITYTTVEGDYLSFNYSSGRFTDLLNRLLDA